ncbi:hypothetical protein NCCP133_42060 [Cytobacillus sp. NCCP-133]|nr:hypothetical protein NCCP133_42060 [Cytobacillus sp. NCCP-133]
MEGIGLDQIREPLGIAAKHRTQIYNKTEIRGKSAPKRLLAPSLLGGKEVCVGSLVILEIRIRKKFY